MKLVRPALTSNEKPIDIATQDELEKKLREIDDTSDGKLSKLGTNATLPVSMACALAAASYFRCPLFRYVAN